MGWPGLLLAISLTIPGAGAMANDGCSPTEAVTGSCTTVTGGIDGDDVVLTGSEGGSDEDGSDNDNPNCDVQIAESGQCRADRPGESDPTPVTLTDIAAFRPVPGIERMEPDGWVVPGLPANIYAVVGTQLVDGTLLGRPATVRFTPVRYHWTYGDGTAAALSTRGGTWAALGLREFDATPTSHVYDREGEYTIRLMIDFRAEYRYAGSEFVPIDGIIDLRANDLQVTVDGAKTVLVEHDCGADPSGPGC
jgi:hypothetical protein